MQPRYVMDQKEEEDATAGGLVRGFLQRSRFAVQQMQKAPGSLP